jgi:K+-transporting ATPase c subunit
MFACSSRATPSSGSLASGEPRVNVLELNLELDRLHAASK